ncbi:MAG: hypothetical protein OHK0019_37560 [Saprospiraceae bacterium]
MNSDFFTSDAIVRALGWTLIHSLWQGALAALVLLVLLPRLQTARQRYWVAYGNLMAVFVAALVTFGWVYQPPMGISAGQIFTGTEQLSGQYFLDSFSVEPAFWQKISGWLEANYPLIVAVWLLGFGFFLLRLAGGLWHVHRLSKRGVFPVEGIWEEKMTALAVRLGMSRPVRLLESVLVHAPVTIGWLKPVVLMPVGLINRLSPAEVEAVLAHELAHIARRDWFFNLLQAFVETVFYYHPAIWWMSQVIGKERENCCDDDALAATGNRIAFAKALVQVQEMAKPALALGLNGTSRPLLLERVRRILNQPQQKSQIMEKFTATAILITLLTLVSIRANNAPSLITAAFAQMTEYPAVLFGFQDDNDENKIVNDSLPKPKNTRKITREDDNQRVEAEYENEKLTRLNIDGKEIPASEFDQYRDLTNELQREHRAPIAPMPPMPPGIFLSPSGTPAPSFPPTPPAPPVPPHIVTGKGSDGSTIIRLHPDGEPLEIKVKDGEVWINGEKAEEGEAIDLPGFYLYGENGDFFIENPEGTSFHFAPEAFHFEGLVEGLSEEDRERWAEEAARLREEADRLRQEMLKEDRRLSKEERKQLEKEMKEYRKEWEKEQKKWAKEQAEYARKQGQEARELAASSQKFGKELKDELQRDGLISDPSNFQFQLSNNELKINGVKQSEALHRKYLEFYQSKTGKDLGKNGNFYWTESK